MNTPSAKAVASCQSSITSQPITPSPAGEIDSSSHFVLHQRKKEAFLVYLPTDHGFMRKYTPVNKPCNITHKPLN